MRPFELLLILSTLTAVVWCAATPRHTSFQRIVLPSLMLVVAFLQLVIEGYRWQMLPAYISLVFIGALSVWGDRRISRFVSGALVVTLAIGGVATLIYPVFALPRPTGPYAVGTISYHLIDTHRAEIFGAKPDRARELMIQLWYPAVARASDKPVRYRNPALISAKFAYLKFVQTHTFRNIPVARSSAERFPVILFSPSWHGIRNQEMALVEDLVSHGFVVVGVDHPYGSGVVVFPDGRKIRARPIRFMDTSSDATTEESFRVAEQEVRIRALDLVFVLNQLKGLDQTHSLGVLTAHLDLARVGVIGYSFGGAVAVEACWMDSQFRSVVDLDGALFGEGARIGITQPFLMMTDYAGPPPKADLMSTRAPKRRWAQFLAMEARIVDRDFHRHGGYLAEIKGIGHADFSDDTLVSPLRWLSGGGELGQIRAIDITRGMTLAFFQLTLAGGPEQLITNEAARFPEVGLRIFSRERWKP